MSYVWASWKSLTCKTFFTVGILASCLHAQMESVPPDEAVSDLLTEVFAFASDQPGKGRVDIYVQVPYPEINFIKEEEKYTGRFEITAAVLSREKQQLWQKSQLVELRLKDFSQTLSHRFFSLKQFSTDLAPGNYELILQVTDQESKKVETSRRPIVVKDFENDTLALSDVMFVHRMAIDGTRKNIVPNLTGMIGKEQTSFYLFFEIYNHAKLDSVQLICKFINPKHEVVVKRTKSELLVSNRTQTIWQIDTPSLVPGQYVLTVEAVGNSKADSGKSYCASVSRFCTVRMKNMPLVITDLEKATEQLRYIAKGNEIDYIREAMTPEEKQKRFLEFWSKYNPNPKASHNALMEEYYSRVEYANKNYASFMEGWKTDRGMVLIRFGPPQNIERHPFDSDNKPFEIWYYYDQNREFIFVDETGFGDYQLRYPQTDLWGRVR
ncbi:MAG: GWxTD domain-containing protein [Ignavibacteriales bacterium]|nr:GWxTD domain-containing protein [Ignavibacteriales bacterium]